MLIYPKVLKQTLAIGLPGNRTPMMYSVMMFSPGDWVKGGKIIIMLVRNLESHQTLKSQYSLRTNSVNICN